ncbi:MAG: methyltransferase [Oscillospiraceae bacterium]|nr:methyltransferase [Oscillospiraceae bacterium]
MDELWPGGPRFYQRAPVFKIGTDAVLLAHFAKTPREGLGIDLGSGTGVLSVLLAQKSPGLYMDCVDILPEAVALTTENAALNDLSARIRATQADLREIRTHLNAGAYDLAVANPPYFPVGSGKRAAGAVADARDETLCSLDNLISAAAYLLRWGGQFFVVHRPERLGELFATMNRYALEPKRLRTVAPTAKQAPSLVLVEGRRGGNPGLIIEPPLPLYSPDGGNSPEIKEIYRR